MKNRLKAMLKEGKIAIGTTITIGHPDVAEIIGLAGFDWVMLDTEHAPMNIPIIQNLLQVMSFSQTVPIIRIAWNDLVMAKQALDIGAYGLIVPWVNTKEEAMRAVQAVKYPPVGLRGFGPRRASLADPDYVKTANSEILLAVQIETQCALDNIDDILSVEGIDAALIGPADLSLSLGILFQYDNPKFVDAMQKVVDAAKRHGIIAGMLATDDVKKRIQQGYKMINISGDLMLLKDAAKRILDTANEARGTMR
ncbi:MAG: aldolase/citrate lyase family protein [Thaumarchaeota archaeon]|nr:aldolase/citrate lyase family protein [Nitrososphaerota archaeon]